MLLFGNAIGFHLAHAMLFAVLPVLVWWDATLDEDEGSDVALLAAGLTALFAANYSYFLIRSGDTNSLAGVAATLAALTAAHAARQRRRWAAWLYPASLALVYYSHRGFFFYAIGLLALDALLARDRRSALRLGVAAAAAFIAGLPVTWDPWRYPGYFIANNVELHHAPIVLAEYARKIYYNTELLTRPGRWFNDYTGLTNIFLPVTAYAAWTARGRARFHACAVLAVVAVVRLWYGAFGYLFDRPVHLLPVLLAPTLAWFLLRRCGDRWLALALVVLCGLYIQIWWQPVPHVAAPRLANPMLSDAVAGASGNLVAVENGFHRDADTRPDRVSVPTPFPAHFEALLPAATGRRLYAGMWDGWQWTPYRDQLFANGTFRGTAISDVPAAAIEAELKRWGVRNVFVWSEAAKAALARDQGFAVTWEDGPWRQFAFQSDDGRSATSPHGSAVLTGISAAGGTVALENVKAGDQIVVRTNYHPALILRSGTARLETSPDHGQLAFHAPASGTYDVSIEYPARRGLALVGLLALILGGWLAGRLDPRRSS